jgi:predicted dithiol-disulfide oxidoreductase (DUF899 family)
LADCDRTTARTGKTLTKHLTGDSEAGRNFRKMKTAPQALTERSMTDSMRDELGALKVVDRSTFPAELDALRVRKKAHTKEGDAIAAARRRLPIVEVDGATPLIGESGAVTLLDTFEGRRMLIAYYFMWHTGHPAPEQCEECTWDTSQVRELSYIHSRNVTYSEGRTGVSAFVLDRAGLACRCQDDSQARTGRVKHWQTE